MIYHIARMSCALHGDEWYPSIPSFPGVGVTIRHPGQGSQSETRAGIQEESDHTLIYLDSGSRPPWADSSGMTASANCDTISRGGCSFEILEALTLGLRSTLCLFCDFCGEHILTIEVRLCA